MDYSDYPAVQQYRRDLLDKMRDPQTPSQVREIIAEHFMEVLQKIPYDVNQLWAERAELSVVLDDIEPGEIFPEIHRLYEDWYEFADAELQKRMSLLGETPDIFGRIQNTLDKWVDPEEN